MIQVRFIEQWEPRVVCIETEEYGMAGIAMFCEAYGPIKTITRLAPRDSDGVQRYQINFTDDKSASLIISEYASKTAPSTEIEHQMLNPKPKSYKLIKSVRHYKSGDEESRKLMVLIPEKTSARQVDEYLLSLGDIEHIRTVHQRRQSFSMVCFWDPNIAKQIYKQERSSALRARLPDNEDPKAGSKKKKCPRCERWVNAETARFNSHSKICEYQENSRITPPEHDVVPIITPHERIHHSNKLASNILRPHPTRPNRLQSLVPQLDLLHLSDSEKGEADALPLPLLPIPN